jgi:hypothetical protein
MEVREKPGNTCFETLQNLGLGRWKSAGDFVVSTYYNVEQIGNVVESVQQKLALRADQVAARLTPEGWVVAISRDDLQVATSRIASQTLNPKSEEKEDYREGSTSFVNTIIDLDPFKPSDVQKAENLLKDKPIGTYYIFQLNTRLPEALVIVIKTEEGVKFRQFPRLYKNEDGMTYIGGGDVKKGGTCQKEDILEFVRRWSEKETVNSRNKNLKEIEFLPPTFEEKKMADILRKDVKEMNYYEAKKSLENATPGAYILSRSNEAALDEIVLSMRKQVGVSQMCFKEVPENPLTYQTDDGYVFSLTKIKEFAELMKAREYHHYQRNCRGPFNLDLTKVPPGAEENPIRKMSFEEAAEELQYALPGEYILRESSSMKDAIVLSVKRRDYEKNEGFISEVLFIKISDQKYKDHDGLELSLSEIQKIAEEFKEQELRDYLQH